MDKEGRFGGRPPILDGSNYEYWKPRMVAFLRSIDIKAWRAADKGWKHLIKNEKDGTSNLKHEEEWSKEEEELALGNSKAMNALFNRIDRNIFRLVHQCELDKDVWDTLKTTHEGTSKVKMSRLQMLTIKFENLKMKEDETIHEFHMNILEIANTSGALGEKMSEEKLVRKILRSLPKRFAMKVTAIEEAQDISTLKVEELIGSLMTFEMGISETVDRKNKSIALVSTTEKGCKMDDEEKISEAIAMLGRQFNRLIKRVDPKSRSNVKDISSDIGRSYDSSRRSKSEEKGSQSREIQCHGCEGYGHIRAECPTFLKKQKKGMAVTWSDGDSGSESEEEGAKLVTALTGVYNSDMDSSDEEVTFEELAETYRKLCVKNGEVCQQNEEQKNLIEQLEAENVKLEAEKKENTATITLLNSDVVMLNSKLDQMSKSFKMLTSGTEKLDEILQLGQNAGNKHGLGYVAEKKPVGDIKKKRHGKTVSKQVSHHKTGNMSGSGYVTAKRFSNN